MALPAAAPRPQQSRLPGIWSTLWAHRRPHRAPRWSHRCTTITRQCKPRRHRRRLGSSFRVGTRPTKRWWRELSPQPARPRHRRRGRTHAERPFCLGIHLDGPRDPRLSALARGGYARSRLRAANANALGPDPSSADYPVLGAACATARSPGPTRRRRSLCKCDSETNPPDEIDVGVVVAHVGLAPSVPAEFIVVRVAHDPSGVTVSSLSE